MKLKMIIDNKISLFDKLNLEIERCDKCPFLVKSRNNAVLGYGDRNAEIMFVGLAPGRNGADITGVPFTRDSSGILFQESLIKAGFSSETNSKTVKPNLKNVFVTNIVKCNPKDKNGNNRTPFKEEIRRCSGHFEMEKKLIRPNIIISLGKIATEYILDTKINNFCSMHNTPIIKEDITYVPFIHPSFVIRGAYSRENYIQAFTSLRKYIQC